MKPNNIPGFAAERSLQGHRERYQAVHSIPSGSQVVPAMRFSQCLNIVYARTFWRCVGAGYSSDSCNSTAAGVAFSVCQYYR
jgi:hypothetical protein